jgi:hypothetical protein
MNSATFAPNITAGDLRTFLEFWPSFSAEANDVHQMVIEDKDKFFDKETELPAWCHFYELPLLQHVALVNAATVQGYAKFLSQEQVADWHQQVADAPSQIGAIPGMIRQIEHYFDAIELSKEDAEEVLPSLAGLLGFGLSISYTLRCVLYHGCFLNELIERVRAGDDKALFDAIRIDSTVIGCMSVSNRISRAALLKDNSFFTKLKAAINGKLAKREQANFQKMRLVFEVLHEAGASRLSDSQLQQLFVGELDLYASNAKGGGNAKALRKFADTYMKKSATT